MKPFVHCPHPGTSHECEARHDPETKDDEPSQRCPIGLAVRQDGECRTGRKHGAGQLDAGGCAQQSAGNQKAHGGRRRGFARNGTQCHIQARKRYSGNRPVVARRSDQCEAYGARHAQHQRKQPIADSRGARYIA